MKVRTIIMAAATLSVAAVILIVPSRAVAHCDTMDGPVVTAAKGALQKGDITPVLRWVKPEAEAELRTAFAKCRAARAKGGAAKEVADMYFFETLVRLHRAGEGAPYTGLKSTPVEPIIAETDAALAQGSTDEVVKLLSGALEQGIREKFDRVVAAAKDADKSVEAGREYVEAYVIFTHYVERLHSDITGGVEHGAAPEHDE